MARRGGFRSERGGNDPLAAMRALAREVRDAKRAWLTTAALLLERQIKVELSTPGRGRQYRIPRYTRDGARALTKKGRKRFRLHTASAPGDPPAVRYGGLRASIGHEVRGLRARVGTNKEYADPLERGAKNAGRSRTATILPRPFMRPAVTKVESAMGQQLAGRLRSAARRAARRA